MLGYRHDLEIRHRRSLSQLRRPRFVGQQRPKTVTLDQSSTLLSLAHRSNDLTNRHIVTQNTHLAGKVVPHPARGVGILAIRRKRTIRIRIANNGTNNRTKRIIFALPHWIFF